MISSHINSFTVDVKNGSEDYTYVFQFCGDANGVAGAGVVQLDNKEKKQKVIGMYDATQAYGGSKSLPNIILKNWHFFIQVLWSGIRFLSECIICFLHCLILHLTSVAGDWVMLIYRNGEPYDTHCSKAKRRAIIMISCDRSMGVVIEKQMISNLQSVRTLKKDCSLRDVGLHQNGDKSSYTTMCYNAMT